MSEGEKPLSKKEQKKLAKKKEKEQKKHGEKNVDTTPAQPSQSQAPKSSNDAKYFLANASNDCTASLKAATAAVAFDLKLLRAPPSSCTSSTFFDGPTLLSNIDTGVAFGGNGIIKAVSLLTTNPSDSGAADEWLELERTTLRSSCPANASKATLTLIEKRLSSGFGRYLVGESLTIADIAIVIALSSKEIATSDIIQTYLDMHTSSSIFKEGSDLRDTLVPPPPVDLNTNPSLIKAANSVIHKAIMSLVPLGIDIPDVVVEKCKQLKLGDYQCKEAMPIISQLRAAGGFPPGVSDAMQMAELIVKQIPEDNRVVDNLRVNKPGFILFKVKPSYLEHHLNIMMNNGENDQEPKPPVSDNLPGNGDVVVVDFSSPNIAKEMHVGHLRSTIIGEAACRILEFAGSDVKRVNHVGDWGTQFGMLITYLKEVCPEFKGDSAAINIGDLTKFYKEAKARFDEDPEFKKTAQLCVVKLQAGDEECKVIWQILCEISRKEFEKVYKRLDITIEECGESFYNDKIASVIEECEKAGHISVEKGGAKCVFVQGKDVPIMLQKSDGGFGYDSTDMAALKYRLNDLGASRIVYVTDVGQSLHFETCFAAADKIAWLNPKKHRLEHIGFGTVMGDDGKRFKTRSGETVRLVDLLDEAVKRMEDSLRQRISDGKAVITLEEVPTVAAAMGYSAVKYFDLNRNLKNNYQFSYDSMLDDRGNTAIYLLYAHARLESIISKGLADHGIDVNGILKNKNVKIVLGTDSERKLALQMLMFSDMIEEVLEDLNIKLICDFLFALSNAVSDFYANCKVLKSPEMENRLILCRSAAIVMRQCFNLLAMRYVKRI